MPLNRKPSRSVATLAIALLAAGVSHAHGLNLFAAPEGDAIKGSVYFASGPAKNVAVKVFGPDDALLGETISGEDGTFLWTPPQRCDLRFVAETVDGHRAEFVVSASELSEDLPAAGPVVAEPAPAAPQAPLRADAAPQEVNLQQLIESAVSREVQPLRAQIDALEHATRLRDVLGGIGYIVGVAGLLAWFKGHAAGKRT
ncbi:MAG: cobalt ABC transporter permease [Candidatus Hydrogenedentes bacterium]|nr:cobalt ABC transporter permease [Candidatus Hydrogenedentota bacterium]